MDFMQRMMPGRGGAVGGGGGEYRMPMFEDNSSYGPYTGGPMTGGTGQPYSRIVVELQAAGVDAETWNALPDPIKWQVLEQITGYGGQEPSPMPAPTPPGPSPTPSPGSLNPYLGR